MLQLKPYKHSGSRRFGKEKNNSTHLFHWKSLYQVRAITVSCLWIFDLVCLWTMVLCLSLQTSAFVFSNFVITGIPLFVDNIIISIYINWNYVVILVIVSFIEHLLSICSICIFLIFGGRHAHDRMVVGFTTTCVTMI